MGFYGVDSLTLGDFNNQNALRRIQLLDMSDRQLELLKWDVWFDGSFGMTARFLCGRIKVLHVSRLDGPLPPPGWPRQVPPQAAPGSFSA